MPTTLTRSEIATACLLLGSALLAACGSGGGGDSPAPTLLSGVAATGAPLAGATVTVIDGDPATPDPAAVTAGADGRYSIDVSALVAPLLVRAAGSVEGAPTTVVAAVPTLAANADNVANVTPLTNAVAALVAPGGDPAALNATTLAANVTPTRVGNASTLLVNTLASDTRIAGALGSNFDPLTAPFSADGSGIDGVLDSLEVTVGSAGVAIVNLAAPVGEGSAPAPVVLTPDQTATPSQAPTLPPSAPADDLPSAADLAALAAKLQTCLALPVAQRVTLDEGGNVTAVSATCNYAPSDWRSNGRTWAQEVGQYTFAKNLLTGATVGKPTVVLAMAPHGLTDPKELKHPYCNGAPCVTARFPLTTASGQSTASDWVLAKVEGTWNFVGNQRKYRTFIEARLNRKISVNRDGPGPNSPIDQYFLTDRYESALRVTFDLGVGETSHVRAVRVSGPGLPEAGLVLFRSQRCGTIDRMGITYNNGSTRLNTNNVLQYWTGSASADYVLDAARLDGSALAMPAPVLTSSSVAFQDFAPAPVANQATTVPAWSRYKVEVFGYANASDTPDEILYLRGGAAAENAAAGAGKPWPTLSPAFIDAYLKPTGASAGAIDSFAHTLDWTAQAGTYVGSGYLFGQNLAAASNGQDATANYWLRTRLDFEPAALGDTSANGFFFGSVVPGTSLSSYTAENGSNPNPRCTSTDVVPLTDNINDYREAGLSFRGTDRKLYNAIWYWDN